MLLSYQIRVVTTKPWYAHLHSATQATGGTGITRTKPLFKVFYEDREFNVTIIIRYERDELHAEDHQMANIQTNLQGLIEAR